MYGTVTLLWWRVGLWKSYSFSIDETEQVWCQKRASVALFPETLHVNSNELQFASTSPRRTTVFFCSWTLHQSVGQTIRICLPSKHPTTRGKFQIFSNSFGFFFGNSVVVACVVDVTLLKVFQLFLGLSLRLWYLPSENWMPKPGMTFQSIGVWNKWTPTY